VPTAAAFATYRGGLHTGPMFSLKADIGNRGCPQSGSPGPAL